jgi:hypothetical protein
MIEPEKGPADWIEAVRRAGRRRKHAWEELVALGPEAVPHITSELLRMTRNKRRWRWSIVPGSLLAVMIGALLVSPVAVTAGTPVVFPVFLAFFWIALHLMAFLLTYRASRYRKALTRALQEVAGADAVGPLAMALSESNGRRPEREALARALPRLSEGTTRPLSTAERNSLYASLRRSPRDGDYLLPLFAGLAELDDTVAIPHLEQFVIRARKSRRGGYLADAAEECLAVLKGVPLQSATLLRPAAAAPESTLLRPAPQARAPQNEALLRPSSAEGPAEYGQSEDLPAQLHLGPARPPDGGSRP